MKTKILLQTATIVATSWLALAAAGQPPPDATVYTFYFLDAAHTDAAWSTCGQVGNTGGCFNGGSLGPFGKIGALMEGKPKVDRSTNTVTRNIYVLDVAAGSNLDQVQLYVYTKTDAITSDFDGVTVTLSNTISLPLRGGTLTRGSMAANDKFLFIGTSRSPDVIEVQKHTFAVTDIPGGFSRNVNAITANQYGYVTVTFGPFDPNKINGNIEFDPNGQPIGFGGGPWFMLGTQQAFLPSTVH
jgi:hypothetical protein